MEVTRPFAISKQSVWEAYLKVKSNGGGAGVYGESIDDFEKNLKGNLYKIWNRMSSGSYFPPNVKGIEIPKKSGGSRLLGIPSISDRIAQTVAKLYIESTLESVFDEDSYGYRPNKSAHDAVKITRRRCWNYDWVVEFDIKGLFDNIDHELMLKALKHHCEHEWVLLYVERWMKASIKVGEETRVRDRGTPQGGGISPILANLFLHYAFDAWMRREFPNVPFCRYADDGLAHWQNSEQAHDLLERLKARFIECGLEIHPKKSKIAYCKDDTRKGSHPSISFDFLGFTFRPRRCATAKRKPHVNFLPAVSRDSRKAMNQTIRGWHVQLKNEKSLLDLSRMFNATLRGWQQYYGKFYPSQLRRIWKNFNTYLVRWVGNKFKKFARHKWRARVYLDKIARANTELFVHWRLGCFPCGLSDGSRMS